MHIARTLKYRNVYDMELSKLKKHLLLIENVL